MARIMHGFGCRLLASDARESRARELGARYCSHDELFAESDIVTLHCPLVKETFHLIGEGAISRMKSGVMLINTSRAP